MERKEWRFVDKSDWGDGPWQKEADKFQWPDENTGFPCLIVRAPLTGSLCGYVGVSKKHPDYGKYYEDIDIDVHGGLTFAAGCAEDREHGICHIVGPGEDDAVWWFGFDTGHAFDLTPAMEVRRKALETRHPDLPKEPRGTPWDARYKTARYLKSQVKSLARQLKLREKRRV